MQKRTLVFSPDTGREKIPEAVKAKTRERLLKYARKDFSGKYTELEIRFRAQLCYVAVYQLALAPWIRPKLGTGIVDRRGLLPRSPVTPGGSAQEAARLLPEYCETTRFRWPQSA